MQKLTQALIVGCLIQLCKIYDATFHCHKTVINVLTPGKFQHYIQYKKNVHKSRDQQILVLK